MADTSKLGLELVEARRNKVPWKCLERKYRKSRQRLYQIYRAERDRRRAPVATAIVQMKALVANANESIATLESELTRLDVNTSSRR